MVRARVEKDFTLKDFAKVNAIKKQNNAEDYFTAGDIIECDDKMAMYLDGENPIKESFIKVIEVVIPEDKIEVAIEEKPVKKSTKKSKKKLDK